MSFASSPFPVLSKAAAALAGLLLVVACSSGDGSDTGSSSGQTQGTACEKDTRKDVYTAGLAKQTSAGEKLTVTIVESTPSPPKKGTNTMMLEIADAAGKPVDGATVSVVPFMPDHAHGSAVTPVVTPMGTGRYDVTKIYYPMPGLWKVTVTVQMTGAAPQDVAFSFCFDG